MSAIVSHELHFFSIAVHYTLHILMLLNVISAVNDWQIMIPYFFLLFNVVNVAENSHSRILKSGV